MSYLVNIRVIYTRVESKDGIHVLKFLFFGFLYMLKVTISRPYAKNNMKISLNIPSDKFPELHEKFIFIGKYG